MKVYPLILVALFSISLGKANAINIDTLYKSALDNKNSNPQISLMIIEEMRRLTLPDSMQFKVYKILSDIYTYQGLFDMAEEYTLKMGELVKNVNFPKREFRQVVYLNQLAEVYKEKFVFLNEENGGQINPYLINSALALYEQAHSCFTHNKEVIKIQINDDVIAYDAMLSQNIGEAFYWKKEYSSSKKYLDTALQLTNVKVSERLQPQIDRLKGYIYLNLHLLKLKLSPNHLSEGGDLISSFNIRSGQKDAFSFEYAVICYYYGLWNEQQGQLDSALIHLDSAIIISSTIGIPILSYKSAHLQNRILKKQEEKAELASKRNSNIALLLVFLLAILIWLFIRYLKISNSEKIRAKELEYQKRVLETRTKELETLSQVSADIQNLHATFDMEVIFKELNDKVLQLFDNITVFGISLYDEKNRNLITKYARYNNKPYKTGGYDRKLINKNQLPVLCFENQEIIRMGNAEKETPERYGFIFEDGGREIETEPSELTKPPKSLIYLPLPKRLGTITIQSLVENAFTEHDERLLKAIGATAGLAIANAQEYSTLAQWSGTLEQVLRQLRHSLLHVNMVTRNFRVLKQEPLSETNIKLVTQLESAHLDYIFTLRALDKWLRTAMSSTVYISRSEKVYLHSWFEIDFTEIKRIAANKNIVLSNKFNKEDWVYTDKEPLAFILHQLIQNAIRHTEPGGVINLSSIAEMNNELLISVKDTGNGMSRNVLKILRHGLLESDINDISIFQMLPKRKEGSGTGLLLCKKLLSKNGQFVDIKSKLGQGSEFVFQLSNKITAT